MLPGRGGDPGPHTGGDGLTMKGRGTVRHELASPLDERIAQMIRLVDWWETRQVDVTPALDYSCSGNISVLSFIRAFPFSF